MRKNILVTTNAQKVLRFLIDHPIRDFLESEIQKATKISKSGVNYALCELVATDFLFRTKRGKAFFSTRNHRFTTIFFSAPDDGTDFVFLLFSFLGFLIT